MKDAHLNPCIDPRQRFLSAYARSAFSVGAMSGLAFAIPALLLASERRFAVAGVVALAGWLGLVAVARLVPRSSQRPRAWVTVSQGYLAGMATVSMAVAVSLAFMAWLGS